VTAPATHDALPGRLPLPVAGLYRDALNAIDPVVQHQSAYFTWEAGVKILATAALAEFVRRPEPVPGLTELLARPTAPTLGQWWGLVRLLVPRLAARPDAGFGAAGAALFETPLRRFPAAAALDDQLRKLGYGGPGAHLFDRLVAYRNRVIGHGAVGKHPAGHYQAVGGALLAAWAELFVALDPAAGRRLVAVTEVRQRDEAWQVVSFALAGEAPRRLPTWSDRVSGNTAPPVTAGRVYLAPADGPIPPADLTPAHPLLAYDPDRQQVLFWNAARGKGRLEYLCYADGRTEDRPDPDGALVGLFRRIPGVTVEEPEAPAGPAPGPAPTPRPRARRPVVIAAGVGLAVAAVAGVVLLSGVGDNRPRHDRPDSSGKPADPGRVGGPNPGEPPPPPPPGPEPVVRVAQAGERIIRHPALGSALDDLGKQVADDLGKRQLEGVRVGPVTGPARFPGGGAGIRQAMLAMLQAKQRLLPSAAATLRARYFPLYDEGSELLTLGVEASLWDGEARLGTYPLVSVEDRGLLAQVLGLTRGDLGGALSPERESADLRLVIDRPSVTAGVRGVRSRDGSPYGLEIRVLRDGRYAPRAAEVRDGRAFLPPPAPGEVFAVNLINDADHDASVELTLDGLSAFAFYEGKNVRSLLVPARTSTLLRGWPVRGGKTGRVDQFKFTEYPESAVAELGGDREKVGTITAAFAAAWPEGGSPPADEQAQDRSPTAPAVGRGDQIVVRAEEVRMERGRTRDVITVRYHRPE
jgi:hypothetical protein